MSHEAEPIPPYFQTGKNKELWDEDIRKAKIIAEATEKGFMNYLPSILRDFSYWYTNEPIPTRVRQLSFEEFTVHETRLFSDLAALNDNTPILNEARVKRKRIGKATSRKAA